MLSVENAAINLPSESTRSRSESLLLSLSGYATTRGKKLPKSSPDPPLPRCNSLTSVSCVPNKVTSVATALAVPAVGAAALSDPGGAKKTSDGAKSPAAGKKSQGTETKAPVKRAKSHESGAKTSGIGAKGPNRGLKGAVGSRGNKKASSSASSVSGSDVTSPGRQRKKDASENTHEVTTPKMPKKAATGDRKSGSGRLFRSVSSLSPRKQGNGKDGRRDEDKRASTGISDSEKVDVLVQHNTQIMEDKLDAIGENSRMKTELKETKTKLQECEQEIESLKTLLSVSYRQETDKYLEGMDFSLQEGSGIMTGAEAKTVIYPSKVEHHETTIEASGYAVQHHRGNSCKECEKLKQSKVKALVETIALKKYARKLSEALAGDDQTKQNLLSELEKKLISAQTEKEIALEELAHVIEQRDQVMGERDRAMEEWGKAATKWDNTLDQVDTLMMDLSKVKAQRDELLMQIETKEDSIKMEIDSREKILEQQLQKTQTELAKAQQRCLELDAKLTSITEKSDTYHKERDHAKEQWRHSVKERKKLHREMAAIVQARDEAIQKCFSTAEQLDKLKEDYNRLLNRLARTGIASGSESSTCSIKDCQFCSDSFGSQEEYRNVEGEEIKVSLDKDDPLPSIKTCKVTCRGRQFTAISDVEKALGAAKNLRKYDEIVSINDIPVSESDQNLVRSLLDSATSTVTMVLRRPTTNCQFTFDVDLKIPKKSKVGLGFECGLYVKDISFGGVAAEQKSLEIGDYILKMNGKHLDKIIASSIEKVIKKSGDKMKFHITRTIQTSSRHSHSRSFSPDGVELRGDRFGERSRDANRLSLISNDSSISMRSRDSTRLSAASSLGSMASNTDSCFADSSSDHSGGMFHSTPVYSGERPRIATAIFNPADTPIEVHDDERSEDGNESSELVTSDGEATMTRTGTLMARKYVSTGSMVRSSSGELGSGNLGFCRTQSTITAIRIDEDPQEAALARPGTHETLTLTGERARVTRLEKKPFKSLGLEVTGGNLVGIFVKELAEDSVCKDVGLQVGDRIFKLNCYDLSRATLDHATRIVRLLSSCTYIRIEAMHYPNFEEILKDPPYDSVYVRTIHPYKAMSHDELDFTVGETLHVINTRANYDEPRQLWKWVAMRARKDGKTIDEGLIPCMGSLPEHVETAVMATLNTKLESGSEECLSDEANAALKRGGHDRKSFLQRYKKIRRRESKDHGVLPVDFNGNCNKVVYYEILSKTGR